MVLLDADAQLTLGDVLEVLIDRQLDAGAGRRRPLDAARECVAARVGLNEDLPVPPSNLCVVCRLDPAQPHVIEADVAEHVRGQLALRVVPAVLFEERDTGELQVANGASFVRRHLPDEIHERAAAAKLFRHVGAPLGRAPIHRGANLSRDAVRIVDFRGIGGDCIGVDAVREHAAVAVHDLPALGGRIQGPHLLSSGAGHQVGVIDHLEKEETCFYRDRPAGEAHGAHEEARVHGRPPVGGARLRARAAAPGRAQPREPYRLE